MTYDIPVILIDDAEFSKKMRAFGSIVNQSVIYVSIINRHPVDILRTVAHEYVHFKQYLQKMPMIDGSAGSAAENQANAKAGELMRKYGKLHPELFDFMSVR